VCPPPLQAAPPPAALAPIGFLFASYLPHSHNAEVVECVRRLLLSSAVVFFGSASDACFFLVV
jgi:hypothetical protein